MPGLIIDEIYSAGGQTGATYNVDYIVLHNTSSSPIDLTTYAIQYQQNNNTTTWSASTLGGEIPAYGYYLIQLGPTGSTGGPLPITPDRIVSTNLGTNNGKIALTNTATALTGAPTSGGSIVDFVGYGSVSGIAEGGASATAPTSTQSIHRNASSSTSFDTNNNSTDFVLGGLTPRNTSSSTLNYDPSITSGGTATVFEGDTAVLNVDAFDTEGEAEGAGLTYTIVQAVDGGAADAAYFTIDPATGALSFISAPDFGNPQGSGGNTYSVTVRAADSGGGKADQVVTVNVAPTGNVYVALANEQGSIAENTPTPARIKVADVMVTGPGAGTAILTVTGADAALFETDSTGLYIKAGANIDYEQAAMLSVTVNVFEPGFLTPGDTVSYAIAVTDVSPENIAGTAGDDILKSGAGVDTIAGLAGNDILDGGAGNDIMSGGLGNDTYYVDSKSDKVTELANQGIDTVITTADYVFLAANVENMVLAGGATRAVGNNLANIITGTSGTNLINGMGGDDTIEGGAGDDTVVGGSGLDTASYENAGGGVIVTIGINDFQDTVSAGKDYLVQIENVTGSAHVDTLTGNGAANVLSGLAGNDVLFGMAGNDTLEGGAGDDLMSGGAGSGDTASYASETATVTVSLATAGQQNTTGAGLDTLIEIENLTGGSGSDALTGSAGNNRIDGGAGDDTIEGGLGTDTLIGGANGSTGDTASYATAGSGVKVSLALTSFQNTIGAGSDKLSGFENLRGSEFDDILTGDKGNNLLNGSKGADRLDGGAGDDNLRAGQDADTLIGGLGNDVLNGAQGADTFVFNAALGAANIDTIQDFKVAELDKIALENAVFTKVGVAGVLIPDHFVSGNGAVAGDANDRIIYDTASGALFYDADGNGVGAQVQFAILTGAPGLSASDFVII